MTLPVFNDAKRVRHTYSSLYFVRYRTDCMNRYMKRRVGNITYEYCDYKGK
ncbi:hypothetical protein PPM_1279 [Paenibacillus polymyxa M1]|nr:hypothetical protein PPM_1279 [Paenibacillus polymyxa M1]